MDIGAGDFVTCVSLNCGCPKYIDKGEVALFLAEGSVYRCTAVGHSADGFPAIELAEWPQVPFCPGHFRTDYRPKASVIEGMKTPRVRELENA